MIGGSVQSPQLAGAFSSAWTISSRPRSSAAAKGPGMIPAPIIMPMSMSLIAATPSSTRRHASTSDLSWNRSTTVSRTSVSAAVLIETLSGLLPVVAVVDQVLHPRMDAEAVAVRVDHVLCDVDRGVQARHVSQEERPQRERLRLLDLLVDLLRGLAGLLLRAPDLGGARHEDPVHDEPRDLAAAHRRLADRLREVRRCLKRVLGGGLAFDNLDQPHHRRRPEEVETDNLLWSQRHVAHLGDREPGGVGREDRVARRRAIEVGEDLLLDVHPLGHGLDDE